jgi:sulfur relay (sulfurtransferase) complex TusBCD TusD component (DsrE family)
MYLMRRVTLPIFQHDRRKHAYGVFPQAGAEERSVTRPQVGAEEVSVAPAAGARQEPRKERTPPVDWAGLLCRTFAVDVFACVRCGGRRGVLEYVKQAGGVARFWNTWDCPRQVRV